MPARTKHKVAANDLAVTALVRRETERTKTDRRQREWKVDGVPGLSLVITAGGAASYHLRFMVGSGARRKSVRQAVGRANGATAIKLADAKAKALKIATEGPAGYGADAEPGMTLRSLFEQFERNDRDRAPRTLKDYRDVLGLHVFKMLGDVPVNEITAKDISKTLTVVEGWSPSSAHKASAALGTLYRWAGKRLLVNENVTIGLGFGHKSEPRKPDITDATIARIWRAIDSEAFNATQTMRLLLKIGVLTGQRNSELAGAQRSELSIGDKVANPRWRIPASRMKRKDRDQWVFLSDQAHRLFIEAAALAGDSDYVFPAAPHGREHIHQKSVSAAWDRLRKVAGVENVNLHDMRKAITSYLGDRGERSDVLDRILHHQVGHHSGQRNSVTESHYNLSTMEGPLRAAWQSWATHVESVAADNESTAGANIIPLPARA